MQNCAYTLTPPHPAIMHCWRRKLCTFSKCMSPQTTKLDIQKILRKFSSPSADYIHYDLKNVKIKPDPLVLTRINLCPPKSFKEISDGSRKRPEIGSLVVFCNQNTKSIGVVKSCNQDMLIVLTLQGEEKNIAFSAVSFHLHQFVDCVKDKSHINYLSIVFSNYALFVSEKMSKSGLLQFVTTAMRHKDITKNIQLFEIAQKVDAYLNNVPQGQLRNYAILLALHHLIMENPLHFQFQQTTTALGEKAQNLYLLNSSTRVASLERAVKAISNTSMAGDFYFFLKQLSSLESEKEVARQVLFTKKNKPYHHVIDLMKYYIVYPHQRLADVISVLFRQDGVSQLKCISPQVIYDLLCEARVYTAHSDVFLSAGDIGSDSSLLSLKNLDQLTGFVKSHVTELQNKPSRYYGLCDEDLKQMGLTNHTQMAFSVTKLKESVVKLGFHVPFLAKHIKPESSKLQEFLENRGAELSSLENKRKLSFWQTITLPNGRMSFLSINDMSWFSFQFGDSTPKLCLTMHLVVDLNKPEKQASVSFTQETLKNVKRVDEYHLLQSIGVKKPSLSDRIAMFFNMKPQLDVVSIDRTKTLNRFLQIRKQHRQKTNPFLFVPQEKWPHVDSTGLVHFDEDGIIKRHIRQCMDEFRLEIKYLTEEMMSYYSWKNNLPVIRRSHTLKSPYTDISGHASADFIKLLQHCDPARISTSTGKPSSDVPAGLEYGSAAFASPLGSLECLANQWQIQKLLEQDKPKESLRDVFGFMDGYESSKTRVRSSLRLQDFATRLENETTLQSFYASKVKRYYTLEWFSDQIGLLENGGMLLSDIDVTVPPWRVFPPLKKRAFLFSFFQCVATQNSNGQRLVEAYCLHLDTSIEILLDFTQHVATGDTLIVSKVVFCSPLEGRLVMM